MANRIYENPLYDESIHLEPQTEIYVVLDNPAWEQPKKYPLSFILAQASIDTILSEDQLSALGWTSTGWTGSWDDGWVHTAGNTNVLASTLAAIVDNAYLISFTVQNRTSGSFTVSFGGTTSGSETQSNAISFVATTIGNLQITPTSDFDGEIFVSVKQILWQLTEQQILDLLGVTDVVQSSDLTEYVLKDGTKVLSDYNFSSTYKTQLDNIGSVIAPQVITLSAASDVSGKISGATKPTGWTLAASDTDLVITHTLTGKQLAGVIVKEVNSGVNRVCVPFEEAYTGITENGTEITIEGINPTSLALIVILQFV